jgi:hypothetical protein
MFKTQPLELNEMQLEKLGIIEVSEEEKALGRKVLKTEFVDEMFDFSGHRISIGRRIGWCFQRWHTNYMDLKWSIKNHFSLRKVINQYRPWDIDSFLPIFVKHLDVYIEIENRFGYATQECKNYKITTAQETADILKRLIEDEYMSNCITEVEEKWGKFKYEKETFANGSVSFKHLTPAQYDEELSILYDNAQKEQKNDLNRLGELISYWWD